MNAHDEPDANRHIIYLKNAACCATGHQVGHAVQGGGMLPVLFTLHGALRILDQQRRPIFLDG